LSFAIVIVDVYSSRRQYKEQEDALQCHRCQIKCTRDLLAVITMLMTILYSS